MSVELDILQKISIGILFEKHMHVFIDHMIVCNATQY